MRVLHLSLAAFALSALSAASCLAAPAPTPDPITTGSSIITRDNVRIALTVPPDLEKPHGPAGILVYFGGTGDSIEAYQRVLSPTAEESDMVLLVPELPWFNPPGKVQTPGVIKTLERLIAEIQKQYNLDPKWIAVGGASAGGGAAVEFAQKVNSTAIIMLSSTGPFNTSSRMRTFHVVGGDKEASRLGGRPELGRGRKDSFIVPDGSHSPQYPHITVWLQTELAEARLVAAPQTLRMAEDKLAKGDTDQAESILQSTVNAVKLLHEFPTGDAFFDYEAKHRQELLTRYAPVIQSLDKLNAKISPSNAASGTSGPAPQETPLSIPVLGETPAAAPVPTVIP